MEVYIGLSVVSLFVIMSFFFNIIQDKYNISSVILLILTGAILHLIAYLFHVDYDLPTVVIKVLGVLGMLVIVLEAVMDLEITKANYKTCLKSSYISLIALIITASAITAFLHIFFIPSLTTSIMYAIPFSIASSAIIIPSLTTMNNDTTTLLILESVFSDIFGILAFNFISLVKIYHEIHLGLFTIELFSMIFISIITTFFIGIILSKNKISNLHVVTLATLILIYSLAKMFHLSALILILFFGILLRNLPGIVSTKFGHKVRRYRLSQEKIESNLIELEKFVAELGFIIRSIFFILLGYTIKITEAFNPQSLIIGIVLIILIYVIRFITLRIFMPKTKAIFSTLISPRGLVTVLLLYPLLEESKIDHLNKGVIFFVVMVTCFIMTGGLIYHRNHDLS